MKKTVKRLICLALVAALCVSFAGCAKINYVTNGAIQAINEVKSGEWKNTGDDAGEEEVNYDAPVIDEFAPVSAGGTDFASVEDVVAYYVEAYNYSKTLTAQYKDNEGNTQTWYKLLGEEELKVDNILIDGSSNATINNIVPGVVDGIYNPGLNGLVPSTNRNPDLDTDEWDGNGESLQTSRLVADDLVTANVKDNGDGTITIQLQPKAVNMSMPGKDAQGHLFQSLGAIDSTVDNISVLSWAEGTTADNCKVNYYGGFATVTIDTKTKEITSAEYEMKAYVSVTHATITVIRDKSASLDVTMKWKYPASADYLMKSKGCTLIG
ncbi:MAG: hypothetical protein ACLUFN_03895 [Eubacterium sp.]